MDTSNTYPEDYEPMDLEYDHYDDLEEDYDISMQEYHDQVAETSMQSTGHTRAQDKSDKLKTDKNRHPW